MLCGDTFSNSSRLISNFEQGKIESIGKDDVIRQTSFMHEIFGLCSRLRKIA